MCVYVCESECGNIQTEEGVCVGAYGQRLNVTRRETVCAAHAGLREAEGKARLAYLHHV